MTSNLDFHVYCPDCEEKWDDCRCDDEEDDDAESE
jgi:hypothetical protein